MQVFSSAMSWLLPSLFVITIYCGAAGSSKPDMTYYDGYLNQETNKSINRHEIHVFNFTVPMAEVNRMTNLRLRAEVLSRPGKDYWKDYLQCPLVFSLRQHRSEKSWALPCSCQLNTGAAEDSRDPSDDTSPYVEEFTICLVNETMGRDYPLSYEFLIFVTTCSPSTVSYSLEMSNPNTGFWLALDEEVEVYVTASINYFFAFDFPEKLNEVILQVKSEETVCMMVGVQSPSCTLLNEKYQTYHSKHGKKHVETPFKSYWQDMNNTAVIPVSRSDFKDGIFIGFRIEMTDDRCLSYQGFSQESWPYLRSSNPRSKAGVVEARGKRISVMVLPGLDDDFNYTRVILLPPGIAALIAVFTAFIYLTFSWYVPEPSPRGYGQLDNDAGRDNETSVVATGNIESEIDPETRSSRDEETFGEVIVVDTEANGTGSNPGGSSRAETSGGESKDAQNGIVGLNPGSSREMITTGNNSTLPEVPSIWLSMDVFVTKRKVKQTMKRLFIVMGTIGIFYGVPSLQLIYQNYTAQDITGQYDVCYRNFLCTHKYAGWDDVNHIYSNILYALLALVFLVFVWLYQRKVERLEKLWLEEHQNDENYIGKGVVHEFGVFYALGIALFLEGFQSAFYHACPTRVNFQFDSSFMLIIASVSVVKIYQFRHPDPICPHNMFGLLALITFTCLGGIVVVTDTAELVYYSLFAALHCLLAVFLAVYLYYIGSVRDGEENGHKLVTNVSLIKKCGLFQKIFKCPPEIVKPAHPYRLIFPVLLVLCNLGMDLFLIVKRPAFASYLVYMCAGNMFLYFTYYLNRKIYHGEMWNWKSIQPMIYLIASLVFGIQGMMYYGRKSYDPDDSPAQSRDLNHICVLWDFYDDHDLWHFCSAGSLFFLFMTLLTLDDGILEVPRRNIHVI